MLSLPIDPLLPKLCDSLQVHKNVILKASPGSGKTTRVPPALLHSGGLKPHQEIWILEPRRVAAKYSALRVAEEMGEPIGKTVGYLFRFENKTSAQTRIKFLTEGMFNRLLLTQPELSSVGLVILDEFHERHLHSDTALSVLNCLQKTRRPDLKILVMSATLDTERLARFLDAPAVLELEAPPFPLTLLYQTTAKEKPLELRVQEAVLNALERSEAGDFLVFLPGKGEIRRTQEQLLTHPQLKDLLIVPLHGELSREEQDRAIRPQRQRKIVLSTNLAESSLTIEGVSTVIDSGLERQAGFSWWTGLPSLQTRSISKASAEQRAGRAARTGPGTCIRLFSAHEFEVSAPFTVPEILRSDLSQVLLELKASGLIHSPHFSWLEPPAATALKAAEDLLYLLGATEGPGKPITWLGKAMSKIPTHPRLSKLLLEAEALGCLETAIQLAARISTGELNQLNAEDCLSSRPSFSAQQVIQQYRRFFSEKSESSKNSDRLSEAVLKAFPDRVAQRRKESQMSKPGTQQIELVLSAGGTAQVAASDFTWNHNTFIVLDVQETSHFSSATRVIARSLLAIEETALLDSPGHLLTEAQEWFWDSQKQRLFSKESLRLGNLVLDESLSLPPPSPEAFRAFFKSSTGKDLQGLKEWHAWVDALATFLDKATIETLLSRNMLAAASTAEKLSPESFGEKLSAQGWPELSLVFFKSLDWESLCSELFLGAQSYLLNQLCPASLTLPNGRKVTIHYPLDRGPWVESRLQDFFGLSTTPTVLQGKQAITLHLLAPNQRAIQVTQDLQSFWKTHYPEIKKELSRRYPRHAWPEDTSRPVPAKPPRASRG